MSFLGLSGGRTDSHRGKGSDALPPREEVRILSESELADYYAAQRRRDVLQWVLYIAVALAIIALIVWQIVRPTR